MMEMRCKPDTPFFDIETQDCSSSPHVCCDPCIPFCYEENIEIQDPSDCTRFYYCQQKGPIDIEKEESIKCPDGNSFDNDKGHCVKGINKETCEEYCPGY